MVCEEWLNFVGRKWGIGTGKECDLEAEASSRVRRQALADAGYDDNGFNFDEAIMPENADVLSEEELIEVLARYEADYLTDGKGDWYYDPETGHYLLPPFWLNEKEDEGIITSDNKRIAVKNYLKEYPDAVVNGDGYIFVTIDQYLKNGGEGFDPGTPWDHIV